MFSKGGNMLWRNFRKDKRHLAHIPSHINHSDINRMYDRIGKTRTARRRNNAVIVKFNDGICFTRQSTTRDQFLISVGGV